MYSDQDMAREYRRDEAMLFGEGGCWTTNAEAASLLCGGLVTFAPERGVYRRACRYKRDEAIMIAAALAARPTRSPPSEPAMGNRLR